MAKYKVGDKVRIVSKRPSSCGFIDDMCKYLGTVMTISHVIESDNPSYKMEEDRGELGFLLVREFLGDIAAGWIWSEKWISGLVEEPKEQKEAPSEPISVHIRFCGPLTVAELMKGSKVVKVANARCNPKDTYDRGEGAKVAVNRLFEKKREDVEETVNPAKKWKAGDKAVVVRQNGMPYHMYHIPAVVEVMRVDLGDNTCLCRNLDDYEHAQWVRMDCLEPYKEAKKMSIKDATPEEIAAMRERISKRQSDRRYELEMDQAVAMACRANRSPFVERHQGPFLESVIVATGMMATAGAAAILGSTGAVPMGYAVTVAGVAMAGAVTQVAMEVHR